MLVRKVSAIPFGMSRNYDGTQRGNLIQRSRKTTNFLPVCCQNTNTHTKKYDENQKSKIMLTFAY